jgi:hypothetical protein
MLVVVILDGNAAGFQAEKRIRPVAGHGGLTPSRGFHSLAD